MDTNPIPAETQDLLRPYLSTPEGCGQARALFEGCFNGVDVRSANVLKSLHGECPHVADFLHRMYYLSARELRSRKGCGHKTFHEISTRLHLFRQHLHQQFTSLSDVAQASAAPEPE